MIKFEIFLRVVDVFIEEQIRAFKQQLGLSHPEILIRFRQKMNRVFYSSNTRISLSLHVAGGKFEPLKFRPRYLMSLPVEGSLNYLAILILCCLGPA